MRSEKRGLLLAFLVFGGFWGAWSAALPALRDQVGASDGELGLALAAIAGSAVPVMPFAGRLVDRVGARRALPASLVAFAVVVPLSGLTHSLGPLIATLVPLGLATGALDLIANAATAAWERLERDKLMSLVHGAFSVGVLIGSASAGLARQQGATPLSIELGVAASVLVIGLTQPAYRTASNEGSEEPRGKLPKVLIGIGLLVAGAFLCEDAIQSWSSLQLERGLHASPGLSGLGPGLFGGAMAVGRLTASPISKRVSETRMLGTAAVLLALGAMGVATAQTAALALAALVIAGAGTSVLAPILYSAVGSRAAPGQQGADLAAVSALGYAGFVAGPPLIGVISAATSLPVALGCLASVGAAIAVGGPLLLRGGSAASAPGSR